MSDTEMGYVYRIPGCGCVVAAQVDRPEYARDVAAFKRAREKRGFDLEHLPVETIRALPWGWPCEHMLAGAAVRVSVPAKEETQG